MLNYFPISYRLLAIAILSLISLIFFLVGILIIAISYSNFFVSQWLFFHLSSTNSWVMSNQVPRAIWITWIVITSLLFVATHFLCFITLVELKYSNAWVKKPVAVSAIIGFSSWIPIINIISIIFLFYGFKNARKLGERNFGHV